MLMIWNHIRIYDLWDIFWDKGSPSFYGLRGKDNPNFGKKRTKEVRIRQSVSASGDKNSQARPTIAEYILFGTLKEAAKTLNVSRVTVRARIRRRMSGYII